MGESLERKARGLEFSDCRDIFELARDWSNKASEPNEAGALIWVEAMSLEPNMDWEATVSMKVCLLPEFNTIGYSETESIKADLTPLAAVCFFGLPKTAQALIEAGANPEATIDFPAMGEAAATVITMMEWARGWCSSEGLWAGIASQSCAEVVVSAIEARELRAICVGAAADKESARL